MAQNKSKKRTGGSSKKNAMWRGKGPEGQKRIAALIALIGVVAIALSIFIQKVPLIAGSDKSVSGLRFSEVMSENGVTILNDAGIPADWIEIVNTGEKAEKIGNYSLMLGSAVNKVYTFPKYTMQPGERLLIYCEGSASVMGDWSAPFKLAASGGETLVLMDAGGHTIDSVVTAELNMDQAYALSDSGEWMVTGTGTPGEPNVVTDVGELKEADIAVVTGELELSEVMSANTLYYPDENGEYSDYVEIHNISGHSMNLVGWYLSDSTENLHKWEFPSVNIDAEGYTVIFCSGRNTTGSDGKIHSSFKLSREGETLYLTSPDGRTVSMVEVPALNRNQAYSYVGGVWMTDMGPTPYLANNYETACQVSAQMNAANTTGVVINEIMASPSSQSSDWIELYNTSSSPVDLSGWGLSDDASKPRRYQFPAGTTIQPGEYMGIFFSGLEQERVNEYLNVPFCLSMDGGYTLTLSQPDGSIAASVYVPQQYSGISYGLANGKNGYYFLETGTPGTANNVASYAGRAAVAEYSVKGGLFKTGDTFEVELSAPSNCRIYYTLDCSDPDESDQLYSGPISVSSTTILRTRVFSNDCLPSYMDTQSYLYDVNNADNVYVVSLVSDEYNLTSDEAGIMAMGPNATDKYPYGSMNKGANFWMDWEREAHVELFTKDGQQALSQECGIKLHGQYSRACKIKGFKVIARSEYGDNTFSYPIFSNRDYTEYQSFVLRASGQDYNLAFMRDSLLTQLAADTSVMYMESEVAVVYINGRYYSLMYIRERINTASICQFEGWEGQEDDIDLVKANRNVMQGSNESYADLLTWIKGNDMTTQAAYDKVASVIDIQNYIEYMTLEIFVGNGDTLNVKRYRNVNEDGKWHWVLFDLDWAFWVDTNSIARWLDPTGMGTGKYTDTTLFIGCMKNPTFRDQFLTYFGQQLATTFTSENVVARIRARYDILKPLLPEYLAQIGKSESSYNKQLKKFVSYAETRPTKILTYFDGVFKFSDADKAKYFGDAVAQIQAYSSKS